MPPRWLVVFTLGNVKVAVKVYGANPDVATGTALRRLEALNVAVSGWDCEAKHLAEEAEGQAGSPQDKERP